MRKKKLYTIFKKLIYVKSLVIKDKRLIRHTLKSSTYMKFFISNYRMQYKVTLNFF